MLTKKITIIFILILALSVGVCIVTRAEEIPEGCGISTTEASAGEAENGTKTPENVDTATDNTGDLVDTGDDYNFFDKVYKAFMAHSGEILGAMTFIGSLLLAYAYRRGLLPMLKSTLSALAEAVGNIKKSTDESGEYSKTLGARLDNTESTLLTLASGIDRLSLELEESRLDKDEREKMKLIMTSQIDMLYNVFMNSSLPEYQKAALSEKIAAMRGELEEK